MWIEDEVEKINKKLEVLTFKNHIVIWGAAEFSVRLFQYSDILKYKVKAIIDKRKYGELFFGQIVRHPDDIKWELVDAVVISAETQGLSIARELQQKKDFYGEVIIVKENEGSAFYKNCSAKELEPEAVYKEFLKDNVRFKDCHRGERLFIVGNAPGISLLNLLHLKDEETMVVSNFYLHKDFDHIKPKYYCFAPFYYDHKGNDEFLHNWISEVFSHGQDISYFFALRDKRIIDGIKAAEEKNIHYLALRMLQNEKYFNDIFTEIDLTKTIMGVRSVPVMCLQIALYMGFSEIYLIGIEHSYLVTNEYHYFFDKKDSMIEDTDPTVSKDGKVIIPFREGLVDTFYLWDEYKTLKRIAERKGIKIFNASVGGILDIFERVDYNSLF